MNLQNCAEMIRSDMPSSVDNLTFFEVVKARLEKEQPVYVNITYHQKLEGVQTLCLGNCNDFLLRNLIDWQNLRSNSEWMRPKARVQFTLEMTWLNGIASPELLEPFWDEELNLFCGVIESPTRLHIPDKGALHWLNQNTGQYVALLQDPVCFGCITAYVPSEDGIVEVGEY